MKDDTMNNVSDIHIMNCGCLVGTPHPDLFTNGARLAWVQTHPGCTRHSPAGMNGPMTTDRDTDDD